eukprot:5319-Pelagococcus_subviridis.AAC.5
MMPSTAHRSSRWCVWVSPTSCRTPSIMIWNPNVPMMQLKTIIPNGCIRDLPAGYMYLLLFFMFRSRGGHDAQRAAHDRGVRLDPEEEDVRPERDLQRELLALLSLRVAPGLLRGVLVGRQDRRARRVRRRDERLDLPELVHERVLLAVVRHHAALRFPRAQALELLRGLLVRVERVRAEAPAVRRLPERHVAVAQILAPRRRRAGDGRRREDDGRLVRGRLHRERAEAAGGGHPRSVGARLVRGIRRARGVRVGGISPVSGFYLMDLRAGSCSRVSRGSGPGRSSNLDRSRDRFREPSTGLFVCAISYKYEYESA